VYGHFSLNILWSRARLVWKTRILNNRLSRKFKTLVLVDNFGYLFYAGEDADQGGPLSLVALWLSSTTTGVTVSVPEFTLARQALSRLKRWLLRYTNTPQLGGPIVSYSRHMAGYYKFATHKFIVYHFTRKSVVKHKFLSQTTILGPWSIICVRIEITYRVYRPRSGSIY
jgi:hypothetical protein